jgi:hypothetical protein
MKREATLSSVLFALCVLCASHPCFAADPRDELLYLPPGLAGSVVFYHSFSQGLDRPEVNLLPGSAFRPRGGKLADALTGSGFVATERSAGLGLAKLDWPLTRPITAAMWFRLEQPMKEETGFHLLSLWAPKGYISNFVAGKGPWCALTRPMFVIQMYNFPGISNVNGLDYGDGRLADKQWHHVAVTVSEGSRVRVYWDGRPRSEFTTKGRLLAARDTVREIHFGPNGAALPITVDELLVLDRALSAEEVRSYVEAVTRLAGVGFPFRQAAPGQ